ncbi:MAG TPA: hypothetical protein VFH43_00325 [Candidatus Kapabacteria bacterium]|nr:hypothetical protein [Candidatus Kapabacteria bacterium]
MYRILVVLILLSAGIFAGPSGAQTTQQFSVPITPTVSTEELTITLTWPLDTGTTKLNLYRRELGSNSWGAAKELDTTSTIYIDSDVVAGVAYEYRIAKNFTFGPNSDVAFGYAVTGIRVPAKAQRGTVLLIVDETQAEPLENELVTLQQDLRLDGWKVSRRDVSRTGTPSEIRDWIIEQARIDPQVRSVFLFGHVPVPYSGNMNPDGHPDHAGAWPADAYYGELNDEWGDDAIDNIVAGREANRNIPNDGKFDPSTIPGDVLVDAMELEVGRVDLSNLSSFALSETELLRQYLNKDHAFRHGTLTAPKRALIDDNFNAFGGEAFAASAWRNFPNFVGLSNIEEKDWFETLSEQEYLWAYGCGGGWYQGANGIGSTQDFASRGSKSIFNLLFGSYFGDWDVENSFLRAPLATSHGLINAWAGRPHWHLYALAVGETFGYAAKLSQNNTGQYITNLAYRGVHIALMGDPTLKMEYGIQAPDVVHVTSNDQARINVRWNTVPGNTAGYLVFRASTFGGQFTQITPTPILDTFIVDAKPFVDTNIYQVRTVAEAGLPFSSYLNTSLATEGMITGILPKAVAATRPRSEDVMKVNTHRNEIRVKLDLKTTSPVRLSITDVSGREVELVDEGSLLAGMYNYSFESDVSNSGAYFIRLIAGRKIETEKVLIVR